MGFDAASQLLDHPLPICYRDIISSMRLINTNSLELEEFIADPPPYAILSHTWE